MASETYTPSPERMATSWSSPWLTGVYPGKTPPRAYCALAMGVIHLSFPMTTPATLLIPPTMTLNISIILLNGLTNAFTASPSHFDHVSGLNMSAKPPLILSIVGFMLVLYQSVILVLILSIPRPALPGNSSNQNLLNASVFGLTLLVYQSVSLSLLSS